MDTSDPEIAFDSSGICSHCHAYDGQARYLFSNAELAKVAAKIKSAGRGRPYDCVLGVSGGVDSCMTAYLVKQAGLNPLAVHVDNGWNSELSQSNIERTLKKLEIDLYTHVIDWEEFKDIQKSFLRASVPNIDYPYDHAILALILTKTAELGLRYVVFGTNIKTEFIMPRLWGYNSWDAKHLRAIHGRFGHVPIETSPTISLSQIIYLTAIKRIRIFRILDYVDYDKQSAKEFLKAEFGWKDYGAKHCESIYTRFFIGNVLPRKFGIDRNRAWVSALVLSGQMTRESAEVELAKGFYASERERQEEEEYVIKKLEMTAEEFAAVMAAPPKSHTDYPNHRFLLDRSGVFVRLARRALRFL